MKTNEEILKETITKLTNLKRIMYCTTQEADMFTTDISEIIESIEQHFINIELQGGN